MNWQKLYWETDNWVTHLSFYEDELRFLEKLLDRYFEEMVQYQNLDEIREEVMRFQDLKYTCTKLMANTREHRNQLALVMDKNDDGHGSIQQTHFRLGKNLQDFTMGFITTKKEIQYITRELLMESPKT